MNGVSIMVNDGMKMVTGWKEKRKNVWLVGYKM